MMFIITLRRKFDEQSIRKYRRLLKNFVIIVFLLRNEGSIIMHIIIIIGFAVELGGKF